MRNWDAVIIGGGIIGLSLALELRRHGAQVVVLDRHQAGREASWAAAGMIACCDPHNSPAIQPLADASAAMYREFAHVLQDESGTSVDLRFDGAIIFAAQDEQPKCPADSLSADDLSRIEPEVPYRARAFRVPEMSVDPRALLSASLKAAKHRGIEVASGAEVVAIDVEQGRAVAARTEKTRFLGGAIVNCAGAWAAHLSPTPLPIRPVKGQMLAVALDPHVSDSATAQRRPLIRHVIRGPGAYLVPRSDGRIIIGSTLEEAGFDKRVDVETIQRLHHAAANLVPNLGQARILEDWAGLRPATPDALPVLGATTVDRYFVATGHYRDGILLAPITAVLMAQVVRGLPPALDISRFSPARFA